MIVADTSALLAIHFNDPECPTFAQRIKDADKVLVSLVSLTEARVVIYVREGHAGVVALDNYLAHPRFELVAPDRELADAAYTGFVAYGKGNHPARLNFGDLFAYALAKTRNLPLLFKGSDFSQTDVRAALSP